MDELILGIVFCGSLAAAYALQKAVLELLLRAMYPRTFGLKAIHADQTRDPILQQ